MSDVICCLFKDRTPDGGILKLEHWPEGYVLWWNGEIVFRSWKRDEAKTPRAAGPVPP